MYRAVILMVILFTGCSNESKTSPLTISRDTSGGGNEDAAAKLSPTVVNGTALSPKTVLNDQLSLLVPEDFVTMDSESLRQKYPSERRPSFVYTNDSGSINIAINHTNDRVRPGELSPCHMQMERVFRKLYPSAKWFESGIIDINGRDWLTLNLRTRAIDTEVRNVMVGTSLEDRLLLVSFNVTKEFEDSWLPIGDKIMQSLRVNDE